MPVRWPGLDDRSTVLAGCWTALPNTYAFSLADGRGPDADVCLVDVLTGDVRTVASGGFLAVTSVSAGRSSADRPARVRGAGGIWWSSTSRIQCRPATPARRRPGGCWPPTFPTREPISPRTDDSSRTGQRSTCGSSPAGNGTRSAWCRSTTHGVPGRLRVLAERDDADLESYADPRRRRAAPCSSGTSATGAAPSRSRTCPPASSYAIDIGQRVLPGWSVQADGRSAILELSEPVAPRSLYHVDLADPGGQPGRTGEPPHRVAGLPEPALPRERLHRPRYLTYPAPDGVTLHGLLYRPDRHGSVADGGAAARRPGKPGATGILDPDPVAGRGRHAGLRTERPRLDRVRTDVHGAGRSRSPGVLVPGCPGHRGIPGRFRSRVRGPDRRAWLVLRWVPGPGVVDPLAAHCSDPAPATPACPNSPRSSPRPRPGWRRRRSPSTAIHAADAALLHALSPLHQMDRVLAPTLLVHGEQDTNVPVGESIRAHRALLRRGSADRVDVAAR